MAKQFNGHAAVIMKHDAPKQQQTTRPAPSSGKTAAVGRGATDSAAGHRYQGAAAARSPGTSGSQPAVTPTGPASELHQAALTLAAQHGEQLQQSAGKLGVPGENLAAVVLTEGQYVPKLAGNETLAIRFEPYAFFRETGRWLAATHRDQQAEQRVFDQAKALDGEAAHRSLRMGLGQVSGSEAVAAGYPSAEAMKQALDGNATAQLDAVTAVIAGDPSLKTAIGQADWAGVALLRAGPGYGALGYDQALAASAQAYKQAVKPGGDDDDDGKPVKRTRKKS